jgi:hypothetical protein
MHGLRALPAVLRFQLARLNEARDIIEQPPALDAALQARRSANAHCSGTMVAQEGRKRLQVGAGENKSELILG